MNDIATINDASDVLKIAEKDEIAETFNQIKETVAPMFAALIDKLLFDICRKIKKHGYLKPCRTDPQHNHAYSCYKNRFIISRYAMIRNLHLTPKDINSIIKMYIISYKNKKGQDNL